MRSCHDSPGVSLADGSVYYSRHDYQRVMVLMQTIEMQSCLVMKRH